jgi:hypothetical protein
MKETSVRREQAVIAHRQAPEVTEPADCAAVGWFDPAIPPALAFPTDATVLASFAAPP